MRGGVKLVQEDKPKSIPGGREWSIQEDVPLSVLLKPPRLLSLVNILFLKEDFKKMEKQSTKLSVIKFPETIAVLDRDNPKRFTSMQMFANLITLVLSFTAILVIYFYSTCETVCSPLKGSIFGIELQYVGIIYILSVASLIFLKRNKLWLLLSAGVGSEIYLIGFQVWHHTYCLYCLIFAAIVIVLFIINLIQDYSEGKLLVRIPSRVFLITIAFAIFAIFFKGSAVLQYSF